MVIVTSYLAVKNNRVYQVVKIWLWKEPLPAVFYSHVGFTLCKLE